MRKRRWVDPDPVLEPWLEDLIGVISVSNPRTGGVVKIRPYEDRVTNEKDKHKFCFKKSDETFEFFDVRDLPNWKEFDLEHPPYRDNQELMKQWEAKKAADAIAGRGQISFKSFQVVYQDPEWKKYHSAKESHIKNIIIDAANNGLLDFG